MWHVELLSLNGHSGGFPRIHQYRNLLCFFWFSVLLAASYCTLSCNSWVPGSKLSIRFICVLKLLRLLRPAFPAPSHLALVRRAAAAVEVSER